MAFNLLKGVAEYFTPILTETQFYQSGVLTPDEFVEAGDQLIATCGTWQWAAGNPANVRSYLPASKQYLITRNVPSMCRANAYKLEDAKEIVVEKDSSEDFADGWLSTHVGGEQKLVNGAHDQKIEEIGEITEDGKEKKGDQKQTKHPEIIGEIGEIEEIGEIGEIGDEKKGDDAPTLQLSIDENFFAQGEQTSSMQELVGDGDIEDEDDATLAPAMISVSEPDDNIVRTRRYDISITYDKFYRTPRVFLFGVDEKGRHLTEQQIMEDISADHKNRTVTVETHPHLGIRVASIHPCKHASVMKKIVEQLQMQRRPAGPGKAKEGERRVVSVNQYMFLFLKFISSVIPTINYDHTRTI